MAKKAVIRTPTLSEAAYIRRQEQGRANPLYRSNKTTKSKININAPDVRKEIREEEVRRARLKRQRREFEETQKSPLKKLSDDNK